ncbi:uncharacterized protein LOC126374038 [Pectinophora gossypiella]|uniref:uncharacterized protein LOC126374038 n=1 Tax=Pectinophora gossypiella TaxID=13191 RepID=UPI00214E7896|nr:uncharacterized protein LOC126374038 [Pectinophora gossypiella]
MAVRNRNHLLLSVIITFFFYQTSEAVKCFHCNSANNSACLDLHLQKMHAIIPIVDCAKSLPSSLTKDGFFCRKITQTILHVDKTPEVRITRGCGWIKHKRECYKNDNKDHLETVCQCFGDMCNGANAREIELSAVAAVAILTTFRTWRGI